MKAEIILTDNNVNIDLNEPTIDVSTEDGFSVTIIGGVGPQGNRGPEGPKGEKGDDYVLTEEDKEDIAGLAAKKVDLTEYVKNTDYATTSAAGVVKVGGLGVKMSNGELVLSPASSRQIKQGVGDTAPITAAKEHEAVFYGLAKAAGADEKDSELTFGAYTEAAKTAIRVMIGAVSPEDIPVVPVKEVQVNGNSILDVSGVANIPLARENILGAVAMKPYGAFGIQYADANYNICITRADEANIKAGTHNYRPIVPSNLHIAVFYGLAKAAGFDEKSSILPLGQYTDAAKAAIRAMLDVPSSADIPSVPVEDVQVNGQSILSEGVANVKRASLSVFGVVKASNSYGTQIYGSGNNESIGTYPATSTQIKQGAARYPVIGPYSQHESTFYGLAKAAGDTTQSQSSNAVGEYTDEAKAAIKTMLGLDDAAIIDIVQAGLPAAEGVLW